MLTQERKVLLFSLLIVGGCTALALTFKSSVLPVAPPAHAADSPGQREAVDVAYIHPRIGNIRRAVRMAADIVPDREAMIYGEVSGYVLAHPVEVGTRVDPTGADGVKVLLKIAVPDLEAAVVTAASHVAHAVAGKAQAEAAVAEAEQHLAESLARSAQASGMIRAALAAVTEEKAEVKLAQTIYDRLAQVLEKSPNLIAQDRVDRAAGEREISRARLAAAEVGVQRVTDDVRVAKARVGAAQAQIAAAKAAVDAAAATHQLALARKAEAETRVGFATILAPFKGVVADRMIDTGDLVMDATRNSGAKPLFRVVADDSIRVRFYISEPDCPSCMVGNKIELLIDVLEMDKPYVGSITRVADALDPKTRTMEVEAELSNPPVPGHAKVRAGMFARVKVFLEEHKGAVLVPARCVRTKKRKSSVMVVGADGTAKVLDVTIGVDDGITIQITSPNVDASTKVIYSGRNLVAKGERLNATEAKLPGAGK